MAILPIPTFNDIFSILKEVYIFPEKGDLFRIGKKIEYLTAKIQFFSFVEFPYEGKKLAVYADEMPTTIYLHNMETLKS